MNILKPVKITILTIVVLLLILIGINLNTTKSKTSKLPPNCFETVENSLQNNTLDVLEKENGNRVYIYKRNNQNIRVVECLAESTKEFI